MKLILMLSLAMIAVVALAPQASAICASADPPTSIVVDLENGQVYFKGACADANIVGPCGCGRT